VKIPSTIQHGDLRPCNIRVVEDSYIFYDWAWSAISHPFIDISQFLHIIRGTIPDDSKDFLVNAYLNEWVEHGTFEQLKSAYLIINELKELFMAFSDYQWLVGIFNECNGKIDEMSADGWLLKRRYYYFSRILKRFIEKEF
jgi:hypothetical protein